jgi:hypothetical protein
MVKRPSKIFVIFMVFSILLMAGVVFWSSQKVSYGVKEKVGSASEISATNLIKETKVNVVSPDGKYTLTMETKGGEGKVDQSFYISTLANNEKIKLKTDELLKDSLITIPYNTFSPDNEFIFLAQVVSGQPEYFVLRADGMEIKEGQYSVRIIEPFNEKYPDLNVTDVTGWGGLNLLVINSDNLDESVGPSFWFDLSNFGFIRLSHRFN